MLNFSMFLHVLAGLTLVTPPIWTILCSVRCVITVVLYKLVLKRDVTFIQFIGAILIVASIFFAKLGKTRLAVVRVKH